MTFRNNWNWNGRNCYERCARNGECADTKCSAFSWTLMTDSLKKLKELNSLECIECIQIYIYSLKYHMYQWGTMIKIQIRIRSYNKDENMFDLKNYGDIWLEFRVNWEYSYLIVVFRSRRFILQIMMKVLSVGTKWWMHRRSKLRLYSPVVRGAWSTLYSSEYQPTNPASPEICRAYFARPLARKNIADGIKHIVEMKNSQVSLNYDRAEFIADLIDMVVHCSRCWQ